MDAFRYISKQHPPAMEGGRFQRNPRARRPVQEKVGKAREVTRSQRLDKELEPAVLLKDQD